MTNDEQFWFAARTRKDQEIAIKNRLIKLGVTHYIPTRFVVRQLKDRKKQVEVPVIRNLIFVYATKEVAYSLPKEYGIKLFYIQDSITHSLLVVPEKQMHDFMFVMDLNPEAAAINDEPMEVGDKVEVIKGEFSGIEGELIRIANRSYVIIRILQVISLRVRIPKSYLKKR